MDPLLVVKVDASSDLLIGSQSLRWCFFSPGYRSVKVLGGDTSTSGGAEAQVAYLAAALAGLGHDVSLIFGDGRASGHVEVISGVTCIDAAPSWKNVQSLRHMWRALDAAAPDVIYARLPSDFLWVLSLFARQRRNVRFIYALANDLHCSIWSSYSYKKWFHCPLFALGLIGADTLAIQHEGQERLLGPSLRDRAVQVPNLVRFIEDSPRRLGAALYDAIWIAQIRPVKQLGVFLDMAAALPELEFAVVGGRDLMTSEGEFGMLEDRIARLGNVKYFGPLHSEKVREILAQSRVLVNTSRAEGFPNTMLEAWSLGIPVVSLTVDPGGVIVSEGLGRCSGDVENLVRDVHMLSRTNSLNEEYGRNGLRYVSRRHSLGAVCEALTKAVPDLVRTPSVALLANRPV
ncbi:glycosyltransferase family 4 protein [Microvirga sp. HBU67558]|uniref:glycosyltransferase family 4 protein n=1 Tax=Microvirga TaxID=186650 RepID=UPI001B386A9E|nr:MULTISPECIES: glycosyltransferase family 4 protein [unclassified Microvirga]MBQ0819729.1 glycosyltransferase family 4 protein [Microvirga sp. HBU67558]